MTKKLTLQAPPLEQYIPSEPIWHWGKKYGEKKRAPFRCIAVSAVTDIGSGCPSPNARLSMQKKKSAPNYWLFFTFSAFWYFPARLVVCALAILSRSKPVGLEKALIVMRHPSLVFGAKSSTIQIFDLIISHSGAKIFQTLSHFVALWWY